MKSQTSDSDYESAYHKWESKNPEDASKTVALISLYTDACGMSCDEKIGLMIYLKKRELVLKSLGETTEPDDTGMKGETK